MDKEILVWEQSTLYPRLLELETQFQNSFNPKLACARLESHHGSTCREWNLSLVTSEYWKRHPEEWIDEVILSVKLSSKGIEADISFGTGQILSEISGLFSSLAVRRWFDGAADIIEEALLTINRHAENGKEYYGTSKN